MSPTPTKVRRTKEASNYSVLEGAISEVLAEFRNSYENASITEFSVEEVEDRGETLWEFKIVAERKF